MAGSPYGQECERQRQREATNSNNATPKHEATTAIAGQASAVNGSSNAKSTNPKNPPQNQSGADVWVVLQGLSAPFVALFTLVLMLVSVGQLSVYRRMREIMDHQTDISERQLVIQGPFLEYSIFKLEIKTSDSTKTVLQDYKLSLLLKNSGRDIAINVAYWQGEIFKITSADDPLLKDETGEYFRDTIFRAESLPGQMSIGPDGTVDTDQIILSPSHLKALYLKQIRMFVWVVMRYGSRLQPKEWFAEIAMSLEFVLDRDPETYGLTDKLTQGLPFRVRRAGYRYRESRDQPSDQKTREQPTMPHDAPPIPESTS